MNKKKFVYFLSTISVLISFGVFIRDGETESHESIKEIRSTSSLKASYKTKKARTEYFNYMLRDPNTKEIPRGIRQKELLFAKQINEKNKSLNKTSLVNELGWQEAGPNNVGGRTRALAVDISNSNTIIVGGASGGIWKSIDKGASWQMKSTSSQILSITTLAQDPRPGHTNTWYYGAGEYNGSAQDVIKSHLFSGNGIYKSSDNGESWKVLETSMSTNITEWESFFDYVNKIEINPLTGTLIVATQGHGIFRSDDGGQKFQNAISGTWQHFSSDISIASDGTMVAVVSSPLPGVTPDKSPGVYKSNDDGITWINITPSSFPQRHERSVVEIAPSNSEIAYVLTYTEPNPNTQFEDIRFHKINIASGTAEDRTANLPVFQNNNMEERINSQGGYNLTLAVKPDDENYILIGATSLYRSKDGFATKPNNEKENWIGGYHPQHFSYPNFHPDIHSYSFDPKNPNSVWWGHDGGISFTSNITNVNYPDVFPWENKNNGYNVTQFFYVTISQTANDNRIMGGTQDNGTPYFLFDEINGGFSKDVSLGDGADCYFGTNFAFVGRQNGQVTRLRYDQNGNPNSVTSGVYKNVHPTNATGQLFINPYKVDPNNENVIYYPSGNILWRNDQIGNIPDDFFPTTTQGWTSLDNLSLPTGYVISAIAVSNNNPKHRIYYGGIDFNQQSNGEHKLYRLDQANSATNGKVEITIPDASNWSFLNSICVNPDNADEIIVVFSNYNIIGVYHSNNGGQSFSQVEGNLEGNETIPGPSTRSAVILPTLNGNQYFLATSTGVYSTQTLNGENTVWNLEGSESIGNVVVNSLAARKSDGRIVAGTHGRGIFVATVGSTAGRASASVNTTTLNLKTIPGQSNSAVFELSNNGDAVLNFNISVTGTFGKNIPKASDSRYEMSAPKTNSKEYKTFINKSKFQQARSDLNKSENNFSPYHNIVSTEGNDYLFFDDGDQTADTFVGLGGGLDFDWYNHFDVSGFDFEVESMEFFIRTEDEFSNNIFVGVYDSKDSLLQFGNFSFELSKEGQWYTVNFNPKINFMDGDNFKIEVYSFSLIDAPAGIDTDAHVPGRSFFFDPSVAKWVNVNTQPGYENGAFLIRVRGTKDGGGGSNQSPIVVSPSTGAISPGGSQEIKVTLNAQEVDEGIYTGNVIINSNGGNITIPIDYLVDVVQLSTIPIDFALQQNYPNPFNPSTIIEFSLPKTSHVSLIIYDALGREVATLINENKFAGSYKVDFDGTTLASGLYIYRINSNGNSLARKMLLIK